MINESLALTKAIRVIQNLVQELLNHFLFCKSIQEEIGKLIEKRSNLDTNNKEYHEILQNKRENMKMNFRFTILLLSFFIDFLLLYEALVILCDQFGWWEIFKYVAPVFLIIIEVAVSYFAILQTRESERSTKLTRNLQYFILPILIGFSLLALFFHIQSYNVEIDGISLLSFMTYRVLIQLMLLTSSIMLHLWLIKNAEDIAEAIAYMKYKMARGKLTRKIENFESANTYRYFPHFTRLSHKYVENTDSFGRNFPEVEINFAVAMPQDLIDGINTVMGRIVIGAGSANTS